MPAYEQSKRHGSCQVCHRRPRQWSLPAPERIRPSCFDGMSRGLDRVLFVSSTCAAGGRPQALAACHPANSGAESGHGEAQGFSGLSPESIPTNELGTVVENDGKPKVQWDEGKTSYYSHAEEANAQLVKWGARGRPAHHDCEVAGASVKLPRCSGVRTNFSGLAALPDSAQPRTASMSDTAASLRQRVLECEKKAAWTEDEASRQTFLELARQWREMAADYEELSKKRTEK